MKAFRRILCIALVAMMLCAAAIPACAATKTLYLSDKDSDYSWFWFELGNFAKGSKVTNVKSSNNSVLSLSRVEINKSNYINYANKKYSSSNVSVYVEGRVRKKGSAKINYKVNGKAKSQAVSVKSYVNPVKTFTLTGISSANLKSQFANGGYAYRDALTKDTGAGLLKVAAASGWKIESAHFRDEDTGMEYEFYAWNKPVSSVKLHVPAMKAGVRYYVYVNFVNTATKGEIDIGYSIEGTYYDEEEDY